MKNFPRSTACARPKSLRRRPARGEDVPGGRLFSRDSVSITRRRGRAQRAQEFEGLGGDLPSTKRNPTLIGVGKLENPLVLANNRGTSPPRPPARQEAFE